MRSASEKTGLVPLSRILALGADTFSLSIEGSFLIHVLLYLYGRVFVLASDFCDYIIVVRLFFINS